MHLHLLWSVEPDRSLLWAVFFRQKLGNSQLWQWVALEAMETELCLSP